MSDFQRVCKEGSAFLTAILQEIAALEAEEIPNTNESAHDLGDGRTVHVIECDEDLVVGLDWNDSFIVLPNPEGVN